MNPLLFSSLAFYLLLTICSLNAQVGNYDDEVEKIAHRISSLMASNGKNALTITEFVNAEEHITELGNDISEDIETYLLSGDYQMSIVSRKELSRILEEQNISRSRLTEKENVAKIGKISNAQVIIIGSVSDRGEEIRVNVQMIDVESGVKVGGAFGKITSTNTIKKKFENILQLHTSSPSQQETSPIEGKTSFRPIEKTMGKTKIRIYDIVRKQGQLEILFKLYNGNSSPATMTVYSGMYGNHPTKINHFGDLYFSGGAQIGPGSCNNKSNSYCNAKAQVSNDAWINANISFSNLPEMETIPILLINTHTSGEGYKGFDFRNVAIRVE